MVKPGPRILVIPDTQVKPDVPLDHLLWVASYAADKKPDVIVHLGDFADMESLSSYDRGKKSAENKRYQEDVEVVQQALSSMDRVWKKRRYSPLKVICLGNHEERINRAVEDDARLEGKLSIDDLGFQRYGWEVYPFLQPVSIHNVYFAHFWPVSANGRVTQTRFGAPNARVQGVRVQRNCVAGHTPGLDTAVVTGPFGLHRSVIAGSFYQHEERFMSPLGTSYWRGVLMLHDVRPNGYFDLMEVSMDYLRRKYG